jgi:hypothetical protein
MKQRKLVTVCNRKKKMAVLPIVQINIKVMNYLRIEDLLSLY